MKLLVLLLVFSCSTKKISRKGKATDFAQDNYGARDYQYQDLSGTYQLTREIIKKKNALYFESTLHDPNSVGSFLEKKYVVLKQTRNKKGDVLVPMISQFTTWINKKKYFTEIKVNSKKRVYEIFSESSGKVVTHPFVNGQWICPFSMLPECLVVSGFAKAATEGKWLEKEIWVFWDLYPYQQKFFSDVNPVLFERVKVIFEGMQENYYQFTAEVSNQSISLLYTSALSFEKMIWVAQGVSLILQ